MGKVQGLEASAEVRLVYTVEETAVVDDSWGSVLVDQVVVTYWYPEEPGDVDRFHVRVLGWRTTAAGARDKRSAVRVPVVAGRGATGAFVRGTLGIDYEADVAGFWRTPTTIDN